MANHKQVMANGVGTSEVVPGKEPKTTAWCAEGGLR